MNVLAGTLGVGRNALDALECGWYRPWHCWTFPMKDDTGRIVGISTRWANGDKACITGSRLGLFVPENLADLADPVLVVEGASDVAACIARRIAAVGRPTADPTSHIVEWLARLLSDRRIVVVGENDRNAATGRWPGKDGAESVAHRLRLMLGRRIECRMPPDGVKDLRQMLAGTPQGGAR